MPKENVDEAKDASGMVNVPALGQRLHWTADEVAHAIASQGKVYGQEVVIPTGNSRELRCPAAPNDVTYVRVTQAGFELAWFSTTDFSEAPENTLGLLMMVAAGRK